MDTLEAVVSSKGQLVIPSKLRRQYHINSGTRVRLVPLDKGFSVYPKYEDEIESVRGIAAGLGLPPDIERDPERELA